jgi:hypothetical protein
MLIEREPNAASGGELARISQEVTERFYNLSSVSVRSDTLRALLLRRAQAFFLKAILWRLRKRHIAVPDCQEFCACAPPKRPHPVSGQAVARSDPAKNPADGSSNRRSRLWISRFGIIQLCGLLRERKLCTSDVAFAALQLMKSLAVGRTIANMNPPAAVPQITRADT